MDVETFLYITLGFIGFSLFACIGITLYWLTKKSANKDEALDSIRVKYKSIQQEEVLEK